jgi:hypothetical protein
VRQHVVAHRVDVGTLGEELVDEAELAKLRRNVEDGPAILRWESGEKTVMPNGCRRAVGRWLRSGGAEWRAAQARATAMCWDLERKRLSCVLAKVGAGVLHSSGGGGGAGLRGEVIGAENVGRPRGGRWRGSIREHACDERAQGAAGPMRCVCACACSTRRGVMGATAGLIVGARQV